MSLLLLEGGFAYTDSTGKEGAMEQGSVERMQAGGGVWHAGRNGRNRILGSNYGWRCHQNWKMLQLPAAAERKNVVEPQH